MKTFKRRLKTQDFSIKKGKMKENKNKRTFQCRICPSSFLIQNTLVQHEKIHKMLKETDSKCSMCKENFTDPTKYVTHLLKHGVKIFNCDNCGDTFKHLQSYNRHIRDYPTNHSFPCDKCGKVFKRLEFLNKHYCIKKETNNIFNENSAQNLGISYPETSSGNMEPVLSKTLNLGDIPSRIEESDNENENQNIPQTSRCYNSANSLEIKIFKCDICEWIFTTNFNLQRHLKIYKSNHFIYPCCQKICKRTENILKHKCETLMFEEAKENINAYPVEGMDKLTSDESEIEEVLQFASRSSSSENEEPTGTEDSEQCYKCENCPAAYFRLSSLREHIKKYPGKHDFICNKCKKHFTDEKLLSKHTCLLAGGKKFQCSCRKYFKNMNEFRKHLGRQRPYICCACNKRNESLTNLINHIRSHTLEKPFICDLCGKAFPVKESLVLHMRIHSGVKPYKCTQCLYSCTTKWNLQLHEKKHRPEDKKVREFLCTVCGAAYFLKQHLRRHSKTHSNEKTDLCKICGKLFSQKSYLNKHLLTHRNERGQNCEKCDQIFPKNEMYKHHLETGHFEFVCVPCKKVFHVKYNLDRHIRNHNKPKKEKFLSKHGEIHYNHDKDKFLCTFCPRSFSREGNLYKHLRNHTKYFENKSMGNA